MLKNVSVAVGVVFLCAVASLAQFSGSIQGTVTDPSGARITAAAVKLQNIHNWAGAFWDSPAERQRSKAVNTKTPMTLRDVLMACSFTSGPAGEGLSDSGRL